MFVYTVFACNGQIDIPNTCMSVSNFQKKGDLWENEYRSDHQLSNNEPINFVPYYTLKPKMSINVSK